MLYSTCLLCRVVGATGKLGAAALTVMLSVAMSLGLAIVPLPVARAFPGDVAWIARGDIRSIPRSIMLAADASTVFVGDELFGVVAYDASASKPAVSRSARRATTSS
jgi:hypothetical protein